MISSKLASAEDNIRSALIYALENKRDNIVPKLFELLNTIVTLKNENNDYVFSLDTRGVPGYPDMTTTKETIDFLNQKIPSGDITINSKNDNVITFG